MSLLLNSMTLASGCCEPHDARGIPETSLRSPLSLPLAAWIWMRVLRSLEENYDSKTIYYLKLHKIKAKTNLEGL